MRNQILAALPQSELARILPYLEPVILPPWMVLYESGEALTHGYFPTEGVVSLRCNTLYGQCSEIALVGSEGLVGASLYLGGETTLNRGVVQVPGHAYRLKASVLKQEFNRPGSLQILLLRYTHMMLRQMAQMVVCNRYHSVSQRFCLWLLLNLDRLPSNVLSGTHQMIANRLGVRREGISKAAYELQELGVIDYERGQILILARAQLEQLCCTCYAVLKPEVERLTPVEEWA